MTVTCRSTSGCGCEFCTWLRAEMKAGSTPQQEIDALILETIRQLEQKN